MVRMGMGAEKVRERPLTESTQTCVESPAQ